MNVKKHEKSKKSAKTSKTCFLNHFDCFATKYSKIFLKNSKKILSRCALFKGFTQFMNFKISLSACPCVSSGIQFEIQVLSEITINSLIRTATPPFFSRSSLPRLTRGRIRSSWWSNAECQHEGHLG